MMTVQKLTFVLGGAASGKSAFAEHLVRATGRPKVYLATAQAFDAEMKTKVSAHKTARGDDWLTIEEPLDIHTSITGCDPNQVLLVDCMTLWLSNIVLSDQDVEAEITLAIAAIKSCACPIVIVSNEVGYGVVPDNALSRRFRAAQGKLNQLIAQEADTVISVIAGLPLALKGSLST